MKKILLITLFLLIPINVNAANDVFKIQCDKTEFKEFEDFTCRTKVESSFYYDEITFKLKTTNGIILEEVRSNYTTLWDINNNKNLITSKTKEKQIVTDTQEFGILLLSINDYGNQKITATEITLKNTKEKEELKLKDEEVTLNILSTENRLNDIKINGKSYGNFSPNENKYYITDFDEEVKIDAIPMDKNSSVTGEGSYKLNKNIKETVIPIEVTSENGINKVYTLIFINKEIEDKNIFANKIKLYKEDGKPIEFNIKENVFEYNIELNPNITKIKIETLLEDKLKLVKDFGDREVNLKLGENIILVKLEDEDGNTKTYIINITVLLLNKSSNAHLKSLIIKGYELKFNKRIKQYDLPIRKRDKKLEITAKAEDSKSKVTIIDNKDLKDGSIVKIIVTSENGSKMTYNLNISLKKANVASTFMLISLMLLTLSAILKYRVSLTNLINKLKTKLKDFKKVDEVKVEPKKEKVKPKVLQPKKEEVKKISPKKKPAPKKKTEPKKEEIKKVSPKKKPAPKKPSPKKGSTTKKSTVTKTNVSSTKKSTPNKKTKKTKAKQKKKQAQKQRKK